MTFIMTSVPGHVIGEGPHVLEQVGAVATLHILHNHAEILLAPKVQNAVHGDDKGNVSKVENFSPRKHLLWNLECSNQTVGLHSKLLKRKYRIFFSSVHVHKQLILRIPDFSE